MKKIIVSTFAWMCVVIGNAQMAETIESVMIQQHDGAWYADQVQAWQKIVDANPKDEWAWRNLFRASYYDAQFNEGWAEGSDKSKPADILRKMEKAVPDSYVLNLSKSRFCLSNDSAAMRGDNLYCAAELLPEDAFSEDIETLACRLWGIDPDNKLVGELFTKSYKKGYFPQRIMHYNWNMLQCMDKGALYFANGDVNTAPMKMIQDALDVRTDVTVIPLSFLFLEQFRDALC